MIMICNVPDEVVENVKMGTWCGSSVAEKMIATGVPLDKIRAEIEQDAFKDVNGAKFIFVNRVNQIIDKYKAAGVEVCEILRPERKNET